MSALAWQDLARDVQRDPQSFIDERDRRRLAFFAPRMFPGYQRAPHIERLIDALEWAARTPDARLIVTMPPRHSKSVHVSELFPAWFLGNHPNERIIAASHSASLAYTFSRRVRNLMSDPRWPFPDVTVAGDKAAVQAWDIDGTRGGYFSVGVGGSPPGIGANCLIIDDPLRSAADADSRTVRDSMWEWYTGTIRVRLEPNASIILTSCMVGDTDVMMADGSTKQLRNIEVGDAVSTYENGRITSSRILNWINHGPDFIYEIRMDSGKIVRANERHPFLVDRGGVKNWIRLRDLNVGDTLVRMRCQREHGSGLFAHSTDVTSQPNARGIATLITARRDGRAVLDRHRPATNLGEPFDSSRDTASPPLSTTPYSNHKAGGAPYAENSQATATCQNTGLASSALTIATRPAKFGDCSVTLAISSWGTGEVKRLSSKPLDTFEIVPDRIVGIIPAGYEDVFDIQVERTENFIANGVVSHNTRWHDDDLTGRLLREQANGGEHWRHLHLPAIDDAGNALWPERWPVDALLRTKAAIGSRAWQSQYLGDPQPAEGGTFKRPWWGRYRVLPPTFKRMEITVDSAFKDGVANDFSAFALWAQDAADKAYLIRAWRERVPFPGLIKLGHDAHAWSKARFPNTAIPLVVEDHASGQSAIQVWSQPYHSPMGVFPALPVVAFPLPAGVSKQSRAEGVTPWIEGGMAAIPAEDCVDPRVGETGWLDAWLAEHDRYPAGEHDDQVDTSSMAVARFFGAEKGAATGGGSRSYLTGGDDAERERW